MKSLALISMQAYWIVKKHARCYKHY